MADWILSVLVVASALIYLRAAMSLEKLQVGDALGPQVFPAIVAICMLCSGPLLAWETWRKQANPESSAASTPDSGVDNWPSRPIGLASPQSTTSVSSKGPSMMCSGLMSR